MAKKKKKKAEMDLETSKEKKKPKIDLRTPKKKAVLIGLKHSNPEMNAIDIERKILRMKRHLMERRGFPEENIILITEDEDHDDKKHLQPTEVNIREQVYELVEYSYPDDILFIHLIAYGCSDGFIITPHQYPNHIPGHLYVEPSIQMGCNLTFVSDCFIERAAKCPCPKIRPPVMSEEESLRRLLEMMTDPNIFSQATYVTGYYRFVSPTNLSSVDILNLKEEDKTETIPADVIPPRVIC
ncbi:hypothetical protein OROGR_022350 [Orobanche gracilis]